ncbi:isochorismate synthase [Mycetocola reblochoni]|uniref:isochorismate synthase n=1 Tax=Mycetocola reblochoni TaxID=331618 RepID=A0A3L6ZUN6_9MICO|nr:isochorismate synthase [Mycetocola reblochoni]
MTVETLEHDGTRRLIPLLDARRPLLWQRRDRGLAGVGEVLRLEYSGPTRFADAARDWAAITAAADVTDEVGLPGTGLVAFGTFAFDDSSAERSVLIVPRLIVGTAEGRTWVTRIRLGDAADGSPELQPRAIGPEYRIGFLPGTPGPDGYRAAVAEGVRRIAEGGLDKVVLARQVHGRLPAGADLRRALGDLALSYPECWTFAVDGMLGASPETLVRVVDGRVSTRVLAGSAARGADADADRAAADGLRTSPKNTSEHDFAVRSALAALAPHGEELTTGEGVFALKLPNLWHLATDITGRIGDGSGSLDLLGALHPTAAVAGTPRADALATIHELEGFDRGRFAGPVGWVGAGGEGEWAIALRCAQLGADGAITASAGAGIVAASDPDAELAETRMKLRPIIEAFG